MNNYFVQCNCPLLIVDKNKVVYLSDYAPPAPLDFQYILYWLEYRRTKGLL